MWQKDKILRDVSYSKGQILHVSPLLESYSVLVEMQEGMNLSWPWVSKQGWRWECSRLSHQPLKPSPSSHMEIPSFQILVIGSGKSHCYFHLYRTSGHLLAPELSSPHLFSQKYRGNYSSISPYHATVQRVQWGTDIGPLAWTHYSFCTRTLLGTGRG